MLACPPLAGAPVRFDVNDDDDPTTALQAGWTDLRQPGLTATAGGITVAVTGVAGSPAAGFVEDRVRTTNGGGAEANMWKDFIFYSDAVGTAAGRGLQIAITGLQPAKVYPITLWAFDFGSPNARTAEWSANDGAAGAFLPKGTLTFTGGTATPATLADSKLTINATSSASGTLTLRGLKGSGGIANSHNVFLNGFEVGDPLSAPQDILLSNNSVFATAPLATLVGNLTSTDPEPGDSHQYSLVAGTGSTHNGLFVLGGLDGEELKVGASLAAFGGQNVSIRLRTTDGDGEFFEKVFTISVISNPDADGDGLTDQWELAFFETTASQDGAGDPDGDGLNNLGEFNRATRPDDPDSDNDTLTDLVETNTGTYVSPSSTGTDPNKEDTDGDGLSDAVEISTTDGFLTDPTKFDTDADGFSDAYEQSASTSPIDAASKPAGTVPLRINEFVASNGAGLKDGYNEASDWVEIYNPNPAAVSLNGYFLSDSASVPSKWPFPAVASISAGGYLVVFASTRNITDPTGKYHTNFALRSTNGYLSLSKGVLLEDSVAYGQQTTDISHGRAAGGSTFVFFQTPTPNAANSSTAYGGVVRDTAFTVNRGFFDAPFSVGLSTITPGAAIRYTLDGSKPTSSVGQLYQGPIAISATTTLRAIAYRSGWLSTNVDTQTYIFTDQVVQQPSNPPGFPTTWGVDAQVNTNDGAGTGIVPADYGMDPRVAAATLPGYSVRDALLDLPSLSIVMPRDDFFSTASGIYANPNPSNRALWERECSLEMVHPSGAKGFQENCIVEVHGNSSRTPWRMQKHSLRVTFRGSVGPPKLDYDIFPDSPVDSWNQLVLRACFTDSWGLVSWDPNRYRPNDSQYLRDFWMKRMFGAMGHATTHGRYCHLYVNGLYWGLYNPTERFNAKYLVDRFGGTETDWEINDDFTTPGTRWSAMLASTTWAQILTYLDVENFADYYLLHLFAEAEDWPHHNGYAATNAALGIPFRFFVWDQEIVLDNHSWNRISSTGGAGALFQKLRGFPEFRLLFADRVRKHMFSGGALTSAVAGQHYLSSANLIDKAIVAESARWGDTRSSMAYGTTITQPSPLTDVNHLQYPPAPNGPAFFFTREQSWLVERDNILNNHLPSLHDRNNSFATIRKLQGTVAAPVGLYPFTDAPNFSQHGGVVPLNHLLIIANPNAAGAIYYTVNGQDPRNPATGTPVSGSQYSAPFSLTTTGTVKARILNGTEWSALTEAFYIVGTPASDANLVVSEIQHSPTTDPNKEFVEVMNVSAEPINLTQVRFINGIEFDFPTGFLMQARERVIVVKDSALWSGVGVRIAGQYVGSLDGSGETLELIAHDGLVIDDFRYNTSSPWPEGANLTLMAPTTRPNPALPTSWRLADVSDGTPGTTDSLPLGNNPLGDDDQDGISNMVDYVLATPLIVGPDEFGLENRLTFAYYNAADDVKISVQASENLVSWTTLPPTERISSSSDEGVITEEWTTGSTEQPRHFVRLLVEKRE